MKKFPIIILLLVVLVFGAGAGYYFGYDIGWEKMADTDGSQMPEDLGEFTGMVQGFVVENIGQPIEGFSAFIYLQAFSGLEEADFDGVETGEGKYAYEDGELKFTRTTNYPITSAEDAINEKGHGTLLLNLRARLGGELSVEEIVNIISAAGVSGISGAITQGPICPVLRNPPEEDCADRPVQGEFIVKDAFDAREMARFSTDAEGKFLVYLSPGEYIIEPAFRIGLGMQTYIAEVPAGEIAELNISFDTGIR